MASTKKPAGKGKQGGSSAQHAEAGKQSHKNSVSKSSAKGASRKGSEDVEQ